MSGDPGNDAQIAIGARLRRLREARGENQIEFATKLHVQSNGLSQYETGKRAIPAHVAQRIRQVTGVSLDWLYAGDASGLPMRLAHLATPAAGPDSSSTRRGRPTKAAPIADEAS